MSELDQKLAALRTMSSAQLRKEWEKVCKTPVPPLTADLLARGVAWRLQEVMHARLIRANLRMLKSLRQQLESAGNISTNVHAGRIKPGSRIVREWGGTVHHVLVSEHGYYYRDRSFTCLTQMAREITGTHWFEPRFFGLRQQGALDG